MKNLSGLSKMSDKDLLALCQKYGTAAIFWRRKFIGLLPEVDRRELYLKKGCSSVYEFAAKFGGVTKKHTQRVIQIDKAFEGKGVEALREMLQEGAVSINKLAKIVSVLGMVDEGELVAAIKRLSCRSLEMYVVDLKRAFGKCENAGGVEQWDGSLFGGEGAKNHDDKGMLSNNEVRIENGLFEPLFEGKSVHVNTFGESVKMQDQGVALKKLKLNLSEEMLDEMLRLQEKGIDIEVLFKEFLQKREENIAEEKEKTVKKVTGREEKRRSEGKKPVRQISVGIKKILKEEYGTKCAVNGCNKAAEHLHHTVPFSINGSNSPDLLKPLCRAHHDIVHSMNERYLEKKGMG